MTVFYSIQNLPVAEEIPFELLHLELVGQILEKTDAEEREKALANLELIGFNAGYRLIEKLTKESPKFKDELDLMKFICKDFWMSVFRKQIDNLRTNHQGVYVLQDNSFKFLTKVWLIFPAIYLVTVPLQASCDRQYLEASPKFVAFTCGLVRGSLANLGLFHVIFTFNWWQSGVNTIVTAEVTSMPACKFQVQVQRN